MLSNILKKKTDRNPVTREKVFQATNQATWLLIEKELILLQVKRDKTETDIVCF